MVKIIKVSNIRYGLEMWGSECFKDYIYNKSLIKGIWFGVSENAKLLCCIVSHFHKSKEFIVEYDWPKNSLKPELSLDDHKIWFGPKNYSYCNDYPFK